MILECKRLETFNQFLKKYIKVEIINIQKKFNIYNIKLINFYELLTQLKERKVYRAPLVYFDNISRD